MKTLILTLVFLTFKSILFAQCPLNMANIYSFNVNNVQYEIVKENLNWTSAAACAVSRGGKLVEINSQQEQDSIFRYVNLAGIVASNTIAWDGGQASYLWIGGNDLASEGNWVWNGDNNGSSIPFWIGTASGAPVGGLYSNWGDEPDNWNQQDALGFAFTDWPLGLAGEWNDIFATDQLYYIIEFANTAKIQENPTEISFSVFPNPANDEINVKLPDNEMGTIQITDLLGNCILVTEVQNTISIADLPNGIYFLTVSSGHKASTQLFVKE
ncbi:T9SS type A sorting domain-containing protein [Fluviicola taffensis]|uniref:C-type lectin domain protein n=1 Tax=Fluviicola taffensis (strain DSM 16823 / NCIMB 13979 / RW262) TaxID=755732 RepID=F2IFD0_FLUTR|nr:T9SS type A sorting domain-containing protein [Fluviicola taffensis]AEA44615.1 C-type lectin domain protein [Fluviicola taffensis DSM 16823]